MKQFQNNKKGKSNQTNKVRVNNKKKKMESPMLEKNELPVEEWERLNKEYFGEENFGWGREEIVEDDGDETPEIDFDR